MVLKLLPSCGDKGTVKQFIPAKEVHCIKVKYIQPICKSSVFCTGPTPPSPADIFKLVQMGPQCAETPSTVGKVGDWMPSCYYVR